MIVQWDHDFNAFSLSDFQVNDDNVCAYSHNEFSF